MSDFTLLYYLINKISPAIFVFPKPLFPIFLCLSLRLCNIYRNLLYPSLSMLSLNMTILVSSSEPPFFPHNTLSYLQTILFPDSCVLTPSLTVPSTALLHYNVLTTVSPPRSTHIQNISFICDSNRVKTAMEEPKRHGKPCPVRKVCQPKQYDL